MNRLQPSASLFNTLRVVGNQAETPQNPYGIPHTAGYLTINVVCDTNTNMIPKPPNRGGRPPVIVPCGWCGAPFKTMELRAHLSKCPERPIRKFITNKRKGRHKMAAWRLMVKNFARICMETEQYKHRGMPLERVLQNVAWHYERLVWELQDEWRRLPDPGTTGATEFALADIYLSPGETDGPSRSGT